MAKKSIGAILTLKDANFSSKMRKADKNWDKFRKQTKRTSSSLDGMTKKLLGAAAAAVSIGAIKDAVTDWTDAAKAQIEAETKLAAVMKNTKGVTDADIQSVKDYTSSLQGIGIIGDEVAIAGAQQIATFQLQADTIKTILPGMEDLLAQQKGLNATQEDAVSIGTMIGKVMNGQTSALSRVGINFTKAQEQVLKYGTESEKAAALADVLKMNVGGVNEALRATDQGKIQATANSWGDMKEKLGTKLLPIIGEYAAMIGDRIPAIQTTMLKGIDLATKGIDGLSTGFKWAKDNADWLIPVIGGLTAAITALKVINTVKDMMAAWKVSTIAMTYAQGGLNAVLAANPIGLVVTAIGLLVAAGIYLYRNWDTVSDKISKVWTRISNSIKKGVNTGIDYLNKLIDGLNRIPGVNISHIKKIALESTTDGMANFKQLDVGKNALGTNYWRGGLTWVGERGKELVDLPRGSKVYSNSRSQGMAKNNPPVTVNVYEADKKTSRQIINEVVPEILLAMANA